VTADGDVELYPIKVVSSGFHCIPTIEDAAGAKK
jgi:hypothetical protein